MRYLSLNGFYSIVQECDFKIHTKNFPYYAPAYFMHILVLHLLLHYAISDSATVLAVAIGTTGTVIKKPHRVMKIHSS